MIYNHFTKNNRGTNRLFRLSASIISIIFFLATFLTGLSTPVIAQGLPASLGVFGDYSVSPGNVVQIPISIKDVEGLYGVDLTLNFDPKVLQAQDSDPSTPGVQVALGTFFDPGLVLFNTVDNEKGILRFVMSQYNPSEPKNGNGILLLVIFKGVEQGESPLTFTNVQLSSRDGVTIPVQSIDAMIYVRANAPTLAVTIPVAKATGMIMIQTSTPTQTPVPVESVVKSPTPAVAGTQINKPIQTASTVSDKGSSSFFLVEHWWIVLILIVLVATAVGALFFKPKR